MGSNQYAESPTSEESAAPTAEETADTAPAGTVIPVGTAIPLEVVQRNQLEEAKKEIDTLRKRYDLISFTDPVLIQES